MDSQRFKRWITNAGIAHLAIVWANTDEGSAGFRSDKLGGSKLGKSRTNFRSELQ